MKTSALIMATALAVATACSTTGKQTSATSETGQIQRPGSGYMPRAEIYKTAGDFADKVPVTIDRTTGELAAYPAPTDITDDSSPLPLADGFLLDRRGIGVNTMFTRYTYAEYRALSEAPTPQEISGAIIPGSGITVLMRLPMSPGEAAADTAAVNAIIRGGFQGCTNLPVRPLRKAEHQ